MAGRIPHPASFPLDVIDQVKEPVLFIHSRHDDYIPCEQSQQLYTRKRVTNSYLLRHTVRMQCLLAKIRKLMSKKFKHFFKDLN